MARVMETICDTLGINNMDMDRKMTVVEEQHGSNGNFILNAMISNAIKKGQGVCLVLCHNTFGHYHNIGMRLGYNLKALMDSKRIFVVEAMDIMASDICVVPSSDSNEKEVILHSWEDDSIDVATKLFMCFKKTYEAMRRYNNSSIIIIDDISHFADIGLRMKQFFNFLRCVLSFMVANQGLQLCILTHVHQRDTKTFYMDRISTYLKYIADIWITTKSLKTGYSDDASGRLTIHQRVHFDRSNKWTEFGTYLYKLSDRQVKVYAPGTMYNR